jgi:hypothetical protein
MKASKTGSRSVCLTLAKFSDCAVVQMPNFGLFPSLILQGTWQAQIPQILLRAVSDFDSQQMHRCQPGPGTCKEAFGHSHERIEKFHIIFIIA